MSGFSPRGGPVSRPRVLALGVLITALFIGYAGYLFSMQIVDNYIYSARAERVKRRAMVIPAQRGEIYDRNYDTPLVTNTDSFAVHVNPAEIPAGQHEETFARVADYLGVPVARIREKIPSETYNVYRPVEVQSGVSFRKVTYLAEHARRYPGVTWQSKPTRYYTEGEDLAHVLGYVGDITPEELQVLFNRGYTANSVLGKSGVEQQYDELLRGEPGRSFRTVDASGRLVEANGRDDIPPVLGDNLVLTIDRDIQRLTAEALGDRIGSAVVLKPATGEVLAMVSYPSFDPNRFYGEGGSRAFRQVSLSPNSPFLNRAIQSASPPASTWKILMTTAVIEEEVFGLDETVNATGTYVLGNRVFNDWRETGFGHLNIFGGLANSSNVFFWTMGVEYLGVERIVDYANAFGFGTETGIDLPGEVSGTLPSPEWKRRQFNAPWVGGDTANMSIGQGFLTVTPLQLANMVAMIVNDGVVYRPHVLSEVRDQVSGEVLRTVEPEVLHTMDARQSTFDNVKRAMRGVITDGTAEVVITTPAVEAAGKTGTSQVAGKEENWHSWFVAYAPYETSDPEERVVVVVMVDAENEWEWWAPKAANVILHGIFTESSFQESVAGLKRAPRPLWYM
ncbi:MAG: penicillin-binding protein 2 [Spirochaetes bacterium]|jgi:penicillin-binding protein 2|nr:penicillin-binding protein 2 [Spirochaetota bacterium]